MFDNIDIQAISNENARQPIRKLLDQVEQLSADLRDAQAEIQRLRDGISRLKGEQRMEMHASANPEKRWFRHGGFAAFLRPHQRPSRLQRC